MAVVSVDEDNLRVAEATIASDTGTWGNDGGGGGVSDEPDIVYQGTTAQSRKVSTSVLGRNYTHGTGTDMDGTPANRAHWIAKVNATNSAALLSRSSPALHVKIGSGSGAYYTYNLFGNDNYPPKGGWQIVPIAPSVSGYRDGTTGSPNLASVLYWSVLGDFSASSKAENLCIDAIDVGAGMNLVGGDGASTDGVFEDFWTRDDTLRAGFVVKEGPVYFVTGKLVLGRQGSGTTAATVFTDSDKTVVWNNGLAATGFHGLECDLTSATTALTFNSCSFISSGKRNNDGDRGYTTTEDTRAVLEFTATGGVADFNSCVFDNFAPTTLNSKVTIDGCTFKLSGMVSVGTATFTDNTINNSAETFSSVRAAVEIDSTSHNLSGCTFIKGSGSSHAILFSTPGTYTLTDCDFQNYNAANGAADSTFINDSGGAVTVNCTNCSGNLSFQNGTGASTTINQTVSVSIKCIDAQTGNPIQGVRVNLGSSGFGSNNVISFAITDVNGEVSATYAGSTPQAVNGYARKGTESPTYESAAITQTITSQGLSAVIAMTPD